MPRRRDRRSAATQARRKVPLAQHSLLYTSMFSESPGRLRWLRWQPDSDSEFSTRLHRAADSFAVGLANPTPARANLNGADGRIHRDLRVPSRSTTSSCTSSTYAHTNPTRRRSFISPWGTTNNPPGQPEKNASHANPGPLRTTQPGIPQQLRLYLGPLLPVLLLLSNQTRTVQGKVPYVTTLAGGAGSTITGHADGVGTAASFYQTNGVAVFSGGTVAVLVSSTIGAARRHRRRTRS